MNKVRLDTLLTERGLCESRSKAAALIMAGKVSVEGYDRREIKPGRLVSSDASLKVDKEREFVSRGGHKLANCLDQIGIDVTDRLCLDVGASTGGFTDALLKRGAKHVICLDVAYGILDLGLRNDVRVTTLERSNARYLKADELLYTPDLITVDVSFISLLTVLPPVLAIAADQFDCLALIKPQFEAGRAAVGKGGVVRDPAVRRKVVREVAENVRELGYAVAGFASSGLPGPKGNRETFVHIVEAQRAGVLDELEEAVMEIEI